MEAYSHAVEEKYRFFSFGDSMLILWETENKPEENKEIIKEEKLIEVKEENKPLTKINEEPIKEEKTETKVETKEGPITITKTITTTVIEEKSKTSEPEKEESLK